MGRKRGIGDGADGRNQDRRRKFNVGWKAQDIITALFSLQLPTRRRCSRNNTVIFVCFFHAVTIARRTVRANSGESGCWASKSAHQVEAKRHHQIEQHLSGEELFLGPHWFLGHNDSIENQIMNPIFVTNSQFYVEWET